MEEYSLSGDIWVQEKDAITSHIKTLLEKHTGEADALLLEYIVTMLSNSKKMKDVANELKEFLGETEATQFALELGGNLVAQYPTPSATSSAPTKKAVKTKPVIRSKVVAVPDSSSGDQTTRSNGAPRLLNAALKQSSTNAPSSRSKTTTTAAAATVANAETTQESSETANESSSSSASAVPKPGFSTAALRENAAVATVGFSTSDLRKGVKRGLMSASALAAEAVLANESHSNKIQRVDESDNLSNHVFEFAGGGEGRGSGRGRGEEGGGGRGRGRGRGEEDGGRFAGGGGGRGERGRSFPSAARGRGGAGRGVYSWVNPGIEAAAEVVPPVADIVKAEVPSAKSNDSSATIASSSIEEEAVVSSDPPAVGGRFGTYAARGGRTNGRGGRGVIRGRGTGRNSGRGGRFGYPVPTGGINKVWVNPDLVNPEGTGPVPIIESSTKWVRTADVESSLVAGR